VAPGHSRDQGSWPMFAATVGGCIHG
jgi:hypothetical protein